MICCHTHRHSIFCILPPHILRQIAVHGSADERRAAVDTLATDQTFRAMRTEIGAAGSTSRTAPATLAEEGEPHRTIYDAQNNQNLPGVIVRSEGGPPSDDVAVNEAYDGLGATFDFYWGDVLVKMV